MPKFFEIIKAGTTYEFVGRQRLFLVVSTIAIVVSLAALGANQVWRGAALNFSVDFRGGTEIRVDFAKPVQVGEVRSALSASGFKNAEVVRVAGAEHPNSFLLRLRTISAISEPKANEAEQALRKEFGERSRFDFREGSDKAYVTLEKLPPGIEGAASQPASGPAASQAASQPEAAAASQPASGPAGGLHDPNAKIRSMVESTLKGVGVDSLQVQRFGPTSRSFEVTLMGLDKEMKKALDQHLGAGAVADVPSVESVGAKAGKELRDDGIKSLAYAMLLIMLYIAVRFDFRYGPGTVIALLHDATIVIGAFALTYKEFSLTTIAALLTIIGYSMNDTVVVFDRIRENVARLRDRKFDRVVNQSVNETLSRTILTTATTFFVTLAMNIFGTGVIRDFAFAMNVGVIVGTYSSIFVAAPVLLWLNAKYVAVQRRSQTKGHRGGPRGRAKPATSSSGDDD